jgi:hypothetical protein
MTNEELLNNKDGLEASAAIASKFNSILKK